MLGEHEVASKNMNFLLAMHFTRDMERTVWMEAMQERIEEFKGKGEKAEEVDGGGKGKAQPMSDDDDFEAAATKTVEDLTKLLEGSNSDDEELSVAEAAKDLGNKVKTEVKDSEMVDQDITKLDFGQVEVQRVTEKDWSQTKVKPFLKKKMKSKQNPRETECKLCHFKVAQASNLKRHMKNKHKDESWQQQPSETNNAEEEDQDQREDEEMEESSVFLCDLCNLPFTSDTLLSEHIESSHPETEIDNIEDVPENYEEDGMDNEEESKPTNDNKFMKKCDLCPKMLKRSTYDWKIQFHMRRAHGKHEPDKKGRVAKCKLCFREYKGNAGKKNLRIHEVRAHKDELGLLDMDAALRWPCNRCDLKFISSNVLDVHMNYAHRETDLEQVELLSKERDLIDETVADEVDIDMDKLYPEIVSKEFVCCKKDFVTLKKLKKHKSNVHGTATFVGLNM